MLALVIHLLNLTIATTFKSPIKKDINPCFQSKIIDKLAIKLRQLMIVYKENLQHI